MFLLYILISLFIIDNISIFIFYLKKTGIPHHNVRWFFIHFFVNLMVTYYGFGNVVDCFLHFSTCSRIPWDMNSYYSVSFAMMGHVYHMLFFNKYMRFDEWFHHVIMCFIAFPIMFAYSKEIHSIAALWFMTGLPGMIDYFLLWLVKMDWMKKETEKYAYVMLSSIVRGPGCVIAAASGINVLNLTLTMSNFAKWFLVFVTIWNGQYYMYELSLIHI